MVKVKPKPKVARHILELDGVDDYVAFSEINLGTNHTISGRINLKATGDTIFGRSTNDNWYVGYFTASLIYYSANGVNVTWDVTFALNKLLKFDFVRSGTTIELFIDGVSQGQKTLASNEIQYLDKISGQSSSGYEINSLITEVRIYNRALSADEITQLYQGKNVRNGLVLHHNYRLGH